ncbi:unnamed protein product [Caretta caretta]
MRNPVDSNKTDKDHLDFTLMVDRKAINSTKGEEGVMKKGGWYDGPRWFASSPQS